MKYLIIALLFVLFFSCTHPTGLKELVNNADSVAINYFKGNGSADSVVNMVMLRDNPSVRQLANFIESHKTEDFKCGYDGSIHFFKNNVVLKDVDFRMNDVQCMHFSFLMNGKIYSTKLSAGAKQFMEKSNTRLRLQ
jgi:hypothetical protein